MKKKLYLLLIILVSIFSFSAVNAQIISMNFKDTVADEIDFFKDYDDYKSYVDTLKSVDLSNYQPSKDKVTIYIFRGRSCIHCLDAVTYFASIYEEYGDKFDVVSFDASIPDNSNFMTKVGNEFGADTSGVPFIVIGEEYFEGYGSSMNSQIIKLIEDNYKSNKYVDAVAGIMNGTYKKNSESEKTNKIMSYIVLGVAAVIVVAIVISRKNTEYYSDEDDEEIEKEEEKEEEKPIKEKAVKKTSTAKKKTSTKSTTKKTTKKTSKK